MTELSVGLGRHGWKIDVVCAQPGVRYEQRMENVAAIMDYEGITIHRMPAFGSHRGGLLSRLVFAVSFACFTTWWALCRAHRYQGLIFTTNPPFLGLAGRLTKWLCRKPYVVIVYDVYPDTVVQLGLLRARSPITWLWERVSRAIFRGADRNVVIGRDMAKVVNKKIGPARAARTVLIPNWSEERTVHPIPKDQNGFRSEHRLKSGFLVQYSGTMGRTHNLEPLVEAAAILQGENFMFQFVGDGAKKATLKAMMDDRRLKNVQFLPFQPLERLAEVLSAADLSVVCLASEFTGLSVPSKAYGVMAAGVPILGFMDANSEIGLTITESDCGVVLPRPTGEEVASVIRDLSRDRGRLEKMGQNGLLAFKARYTLERIAERYDQVLSTAFLGRRPGFNAATPT